MGAYFVFRFLNYMASFFAALRLLGGFCGPLGALLGALRRSWAAPGDAFGHFWAALARSWAALGVLLAVLGCFWAALGRSQSPTVKKTPL